MPVLKYRPYFTLGELKEIVLCLKSSPSTTRLALIRYLDGFIHKIESGLQEPNHTLKPTLLERLELDDSTPIPISHTITGKIAYEKWIISPSKCTVKEIEEAMTYRYENDLMSKEEEESFEIRMIGS